MDHFREEIVVRRNRGLQSALYALCWLGIVFFGFVALIYLQGTVMQLNFNIPGIVILLVSGGAAVLLYLRKDNLRLEYEYTFTNGELDFAMVLGNRRRKELGSMRVRNVEACGLVAHPSFQRYITMPGIRKNNWFLNRGANLFYFYFVKDGSKRLIVIEPSQEMVALIKSYAAHNAFQG
ncbi:MAG: hypothetical protein LBU67_00950 [Oscillospiraceae bacterium]|jgi:hypothetical protein|nr:hypothetical protein [Oscillospiraceae bacterium]